MQDDFVADIEIPVETCGIDFPQCVGDVGSYQWRHPYHQRHCPDYPYPYRRQ